MLSLCICNVSPASVGYEFVNIVTCSNCSPVLIASSSGLILQERVKEPKQKVKRIERAGEKYELSRWTPVVQDIAEVMPPVLPSVCVVCVCVCVWLYLPVCWTVCSVFNISTVTFVYAPVPHSMQLKGDWMRVMHRSFASLAPPLAVLVGGAPVAHRPRRLVSPPLAYASAGIGCPHRELVERRANK